MSKVTVVGAGNVGATTANVLVTSQVANEVVLIDIKEGVSEGKAMDIMQTANILGLQTRLTGVTNDYSLPARPAWPARNLSASTQRSSRW